MCILKLQFVNFLSDPCKAQQLNHINSPFCAHRSFTCLFLLSCCYLELAIGSHALWHSVALTLSGRVITLSQLWNSGKFKAKKPEVSVISSQQLASCPGEEVPVGNVHGFFTLCITAQWWALERRNWMLGLTTSYEVAYIHVGSAPLCLFS